MRIGPRSYALAFPLRALLPAAAAALIVAAPFRPVAASPIIKMTVSVLAKGVEKHQASSIPREETEVFSPNDAQAVMWLKIGDISGVHSLRWEWYDPSGKLYYKTPDHKINADGKRREQSTSWHKIGIKDETAAGLPGQWQVKVFLDNSLVASRGFLMQGVPGIRDLAGMPGVKPDRSKWALVIGIERYRKAAPVRFAEKDARAMRDYFTNLLGVPEENTILLVNERATKAEVDALIKDRLPGLLSGQDTLYLYYAGHGVPAEEAPYLLPYDGDPGSPGQTAYAVETLYADLERLPAKNIFVFMDTCFSGRSGRDERENMVIAGARPGALKVRDPLLLSNKIVVMAAAKSNQLSNYYKEEGHGLFTHYLLKGLIGEADADGDKKIRALELARYVEEEVGAASRRLFGLNRRQDPVALPRHLAGKEELELATVR